MKKFIALIISIVSVLAVFSFSACGGSESGGNNDQPGGSTDTEQTSTEQSDGSTEGGDAGAEVTTAEVASVTISGDTAVYIGYTMTLTANVVMSDGSVYDGEITWASSDEYVATVADGMITGVTKGTADITATAGGVTSEAYAVAVGERPSDKVDADGWVAAMTSMDIYNSTASIINKRQVTSVENITNETESSYIINVDLTETDGTVTGNISTTTEDGDVEISEYYQYDGTNTKFYSTNGDVCETVTTSYDTLLEECYMQYMFADAAIYEDFSYSEEEGAYVLESSGFYYENGGAEYNYDSTKHIIKIVDGNLVYFYMNYAYSCTIAGIGTYYVILEVEVNYTYGGVTVTIPEDIQSQFDALKSDDEESADYSDYTDSTAE